MLKSLRRLSTGLVLTFFCITSVGLANDKTLIHYWNFNNSRSAATLLTSSFTISDSALLIDAQLTGDAEIAFPPADNNTGQGFAGENARMGDEALSHLRVNNPLGAVLTIPLPTSGYENVVFKYETRRSGQGAGTQIVSYTIDGESFTPFINVATFNDDPVLITLDFSAISETSDNEDFAIRIAFEEGSGGVAGNNRFDNMTLDGDPLEGTNVPPVQVEEIPAQFVSTAVSSTIDLNDYFSDGDDDLLTFSLTVDNGAIASVVGPTVPGDGEITISGGFAGETTVNVSVSDGVNPTIQSSFRVLSYPPAHPMKEGSFEFTSWDEDAPEGAYPSHMIFLQSNLDDPMIDAPLLFAYKVGTDAPVSENIGFPYRNQSRTRINGLGNDGISFINTGRGRDLGGALVSLDTRDINEASLSFLAGTITPNSRTYNLIVQYRLVEDGTFGQWINLTNQFGNNVEYLRNPNPGHIQLFNAVSLPSALMGEETVHILFRYYYTGIRLSEESGARDMIRLDNVVIHEVTGSNIDDPAEFPDKVVLSQNYPNPFNPSTVINFTIPADLNESDATLIVYDVLGREITTLIDQRLASGLYSVNFDASGLSSGVYIYRLTSNGQTVTRKMMLTR